MTPQETQDAELAIVQSHVNALMEHFDSVQVFVTRHDQATLDGTMSINMGSGNVFARRGQVQEWLSKEDEYSRIECRRE